MIPLIISFLYNHLIIVLVVHGASFYPSAETNNAKRHFFSVQMSEDNLTSLMFPHFWMAVVDAGRNTLDYNLSVECSAALTVYVTALEHKEMWALRMYDSTGKMVSGMLLGALVQHGNYDECINIHRYPELDLESQEHEPHYCSAFFSTPTWIFTFVQSLDISFPTWLSYVSAEFCVPKRCGKEDLSNIISTYISNGNFSVRLNEVSCYSQPLITEDTAALVVIAIISSLLLLVTIGTVIDILEHLDKFETVSGEINSIGYQGSYKRFSRFRASLLHYWNQIGGTEHKTIKRRATIGGYKPSLIRRISNSLIRKRPLSKQESVRRGTNRSATDLKDKHDDLLPSSHIQLKNSMCFSETSVPWPSLTSFNTKVVENLSNKRRKSCPELYQDNPERPHMNAKSSNRSFTETFTLGENAVAHDSGLARNGTENKAFCFTLEDNGIAKEENTLSFVLTPQTDFLEKSQLGIIPAVKYPYKTVSIFSPKQQSPFSVTHCLPNFHSENSKNNTSTEQTDNETFSLKESYTSQPLKLLKKYEVFQDQTNIDKMNDAETVMFNKHNTSSVDFSNKLAASSKTGSCLHFSKCSPSTVSFKKSLESSSPSISVDSSNIPSSSVNVLQATTSHLFSIPEETTVECGIHLQSSMKNLQEWKNNSTFVQREKCVQGSDKNHCFYKTNLKESSILQRSLIVEILLCFSFLRSVRKLLSEGNPDHLFSVNGVRVLSIFWIVLGSSISLLYSNSDMMANNIDTVKMTRNLWFHAIMNTSLASDSFFVLSGCLVTYHFFLSKKKEQECKLGTISLTLKELFHFYSHRLMRLLPCYLVVIMVYTVLIPYFGYGQQRGTTYDALKKCQTQWWTNVIFISNLYGADTMCMPWTYYLVNDLQFYFISPLVLYPLLYFPRLGWFLLVVLGSTQIISTGLLTKDIDGNNLIMDSQYFANVYSKPYCRIGSFAVGMGLGYVLYSTDRRIYFQKIPLITGWLASLCIVGTLVYITHLWAREGGEQWTVIQMSFYEAFSRMAWSLALSWIIFTCSIGQGGFVYRLLSWNGFLPLSRITYGVYLIHPVLITIVINSTRSPFYIQFGSLIYFYVSNLVCSFGLGFFLIAFFECPFTGLDQVLKSRQTG